MKNLKKWTSILLALAMLVTMLPLSVAVHADCTTAATNLPVSTVNDNDYKTYGEVVTSTLSVQADGRLMTVSHPRDPANPVDYVEISYYKTSYNNTIRCIDVKSIDFGKVKYQWHPMDKSEVQPVEMVRVNQ